MTMRRFVHAAALSLALAASGTEAFAQPASPSRWSKVRAAKWALLAAGVGLGAFALVESRTSERSYSQLFDLCESQPLRCELDAGRYLDAEAEALYQQSLRADRNARIGIIGGEITLLGSAALFIFDLRNSRGPDNIPFPGSASRASPAIRAGIRLPLNP